MSSKNPFAKEVPHAGRGRKVAILIAASVVLAVLIWVVTSGFRGRQIDRNTKALTTPVVKVPTPR